MNKGIWVAVVDADQAYSDSLKAVLSAQHWVECVSVHTSHEQARQELNGSMPDAVVADLLLTSPSALEFIGELQAARPSAEVLIVTNRRDELSVLSALRAGAAGYLLKPTPLASICEALAEIRDGGCPLSSEVARHVARWFHAHPRPVSKVAQLSARQQEILFRVADGLRNKQIAAALGLSEATVRAHLRLIFEKLNVHSRVEAVAYLRRSQLWRGDS